MRRVQPRGISIAVERRETMLNCASMVTACAVERKRLVSAQLRLRPTICTSEGQDATEKPMSIIDDADFLTNRTKQLSAVRELANLRERLVDLQSELLNRMHERRQIIQRVAEQDLTRQQQSGRASRTAAVQRARASDEVRSFDQSVA